MVTVSFLVPTLNRGTYVLRTVERCLAAGRSAAVAVEVIVLDSQSDDGSWEALEQRFGQVPEVKLLQNRRGLGPTKSWLDAAEHASGTYVTYIWSDDYVSDGFVSACLKGLNATDELVIGKAVIRHVDDESALPHSDHVGRVPASDLIAAYFGIAHPELDVPVSPASSLFSRAAFADWRQAVSKYCLSSELREKLLWKRAIGPDLMLFLTALGRQRGAAPRLDGVVAQFSEHEGSITISSPQWMMEAGYWLARAWFAKGQVFAADIAPALRSEVIGRTMLYGLRLAALAPRGSPLGDRRKLRRAILEEVTEVWREARRRRTGLRALFGGGRAMSNELATRLRGVRA